MTLIFKQPTNQHIHVVVWWVYFYDIDETLNVQIHAVVSYLQTLDFGEGKLNN